ncbi:MAG TPA: hypothetical protein PK295_02720 [Candidatus Magasanikbacteria bacterium]|nr:hypothetical protein [Candidatus Magasanikbacteria bacterium]
MSEPTFPQMQHFFVLVGEGKITAENFQSFLENPNKFFEGNLTKDMVVPTTMTVGARTYDILRFHRGRQKSTMVDQAKDLSAHLGQEDGKHILKHQDDIPAVLRGKVNFVFTDWRHPDDQGRVAYVVWNGDGWVQDWEWLVPQRSGRSRMLRRK